MFVAVKTLILNDDRDKNISLGDTTLEMVKKRGFFIWQKSEKSDYQLHRIFQDPLMVQKLWTAS